tara:strand:- start:6367 stop:6879 length:513 start_codon:yes stop_codon:yes gene_type:complete
MRTFKSLRNYINEAKLSDEMIKRKFPQVWAASAKEPKILDMFHKSVNTGNMNAKTKAYQKMKIGPFIRDELNGGYLDRAIIKKLNLKASTDLSALKLDGLNEAKVSYNGGFEKGRGPTGIAFSIPHGHPDAEDPRTRKVYPERQKPAYKKAYIALLKKKNPKLLGQFPVR